MGYDPKMGGSGGAGVVPLNVLHTADWHLGRALYGRRRDEEFAGFLSWLVETIAREEIHVLLVAGDVFDTSTPSNRAQELYYRFLGQIKTTACRHVVIIGGNHDSPSFLNAPQDLLQAFDVHVIGSKTADPADEVRVLRDAKGRPELIVCAVPYLRDRDIREAQPGESIEDKGRKLIEGITGHYAEVAACAEALRAEMAVDVPIIGMGHLFTAGGKTTDDDGVRDLYVGSLAHVTAEVFPPCLDYVALGHLHVPQRVGGGDRVRYSGSPIPMGFGEARQEKVLLKLRCKGRQLVVEPIAVPVFQALASISGDWTAIEQGIRAQLAKSGSCWLEVNYTGAEIITDLRERIDALIEGSPLEVLRVRNQRLTEQVLTPNLTPEALEELDVAQVFVRCLEAHEVPEEQRPELLQAYRDILESVAEADDDRARV